MAHKALDDMMNEISLFIFLNGCFDFLYLLPGAFSGNGAYALPLPSLKLMKG